MMPKNTMRAFLLRPLAIAVAAALSAGLLGAAPAAAAEEGLPDDGASVSYGLPGGLPVVDSAVGRGARLEAGAARSIPVGGGARSALVRLSVLDAPAALELLAAGAPALSVPARGSASTTVLVPVREGTFSLLSSAGADVRVEVLATFAEDADAPGATIALETPVSRPSEALALTAGVPTAVGLTGVGGVPATQVRAVHLTLTVDAAAPTTIEFDGQRLPVAAGRTSISTIATPSAAGEALLAADSAVRVRVDVRGYVPEAAENAVTANGPGSFWPLAIGAPSTHAVTDAAGTAIALPALPDAGHVLALVWASAADDLTLLEAGPPYRGRARGAAVDPARGAQPQLALLPAEEAQLTLRRGDAEARVLPLGTLLAQTPRPGAETSLRVDSPAGGAQELETPFLEFTGTAQTAGTAPLRLEVRRDGEPHGIASLHPGDAGVGWSFRSPIQASADYTYEFTLVGRDGSRTAVSWQGQVTVPGADEPYILHPDAVPLGHPGHDAPILGLDEGTVRFAGNPDLEPGQVIIAAAVEGAPEGFLRRVVAIDNDGAVWTVTTGAATLAEVFLQVRYNQYQPMFDQAPPEITVTQPDDPDTTAEFTPTVVQQVPIEDADLAPYPDLADPVSQDDDYYDIDLDAELAGLTGGGGGGGMFPFSRQILPNRMPVPPHPVIEDEEGGKPIPPKGTVISLGGEPKLSLSKTFPITDEVKASTYAYKLNLQAKLSFSISLQLKLEVVYRWVDKPLFDPGYPEVTVKNVVVALKRESKIEVSGGVEFTGKYEKKFQGPGFDLAFNSVTFMIGPVPVVITASLKISTPIVLAGNASFKASVTAGLQASSRHGFEYVDGVHNTIREEKFTYKEPTMGSGALLSGEVKVEAGANLSASLKLYGAAGPELGAGLSAGISAKASLNPEPKAKLAIYATGTIEVEVVFDVPVIDYRVGAYTLVDAKFTFDLWAKEFEYRTVFDTKPDGTPSDPPPGPDPDPDPEPEPIDALEWITSIYSVDDVDAVRIIGAEWVEGPPSPSSVAVLDGDPFEVGSDQRFAVMSTGEADPRGPYGGTYVAESDRGGKVYDATTIRIDLSAPATQCMWLRYAVITERPYDHDGDVIIIESGRTSWSHDGENFLVPDSAAPYVDREYVDRGGAIPVDDVAGSLDREEGNIWPTWVGTTAVIPSGSSSLFLSLADMFDSSGDTIIGLSDLSFSPTDVCEPQSSMEH